MAILHSFGVLLHSLMIYANLTLYGKHKGKIIKYKRSR
ncbi:MAG: hypothetical protein US35_C0020G0006 [Parcubacteria group bacterium GW2011_GWA2_37_10]|nr:MAG: hypothetical protein US35_C0020G0006 [Parcubacteria group bacterium GW2011_GWA2_37_10]